MARYACPACGAHLQVDHDIIEGDGERFRGAIQKEESITCGTCGQTHPAARWLDATRKAGLPVLTPEAEAEEEDGQETVKAPAPEPRTQKESKVAPKPKVAPKAAPKVGKGRGKRG